ncbi:P-loop containing nucleoside triphosphate hydrolase protein [Aspergillus unguis]
MACPEDAAFGPRVSTTCRSFDFTLTFEDAFLSILPTALFLLISPIAIYRLRNEAQKIRRSLLLGWKLTTLSALFASHLVFLIVREKQKSPGRDSLSLAADCLELVAFLIALVLSYVSHCRSIRPSTPLVIFLSARSLLGIARVRTLWLGPQTKAAVPFTIGFVLTILSTILESFGKESLLEVDKDKDPTPEPFSGFWKRASFVWLAGTFRRGYVKVLSVDDLPGLDGKLDSDAVAGDLQRVWDGADKSSRYALLKACFRAYLVPFLAAAIPRAIMIGFTFCQPFLINATVSWVGLRDAPADSGKALIGGFALVYVGLAVCTALYGYQNYRFTIRLRGGLISLIHTSTMRGRAVERGETTAITLMGTDVERIVTGFRVVHELWACLVDIAIAVYLLQRQVGAACAVPVGIVVLFILCTFKLSSATNRFQRRWIEKVEDRLRLTSYTLENIKAVKMLGLAERLFSIIQGLREAEIAASAVFRKLLIGTITLSNSPQDLAPMATFTVYVAIALTRHDNSILAAQAFTSLSLISLVTAPVLTFIQAVPSVVQCLGCFARIQEYCSVGYSSGGEDNGKNQGEKDIALQSMPDMATTEKYLVRFTNCTVSWKTTPVLKDLTLTINPGTTMLIGQIGSGKSTLLESILGETYIVNGHSERNFSSAAYCAQTPWLQSQSIKENIIGAAKEDVEWYNTVIAACGLERDLKSLPNGDATAVGSNGMVLSGGQKQRIALARALYSRCRTILLDDVFSGIDATGTDAIARNLFSENGLVRSIGASVVLATHSGFLLRYADSIVVLEGGRVADSGELEELRARNEFVQGLQTSPSSSISDGSNDSIVSTLPANNPPQTHGTDESAIETDNNDNDSTNDFARRDGDFSVYKYYISAAGQKTIVFVLGLIMLWAVLHEFSTVWLDFWTEANTESPNSRVGMYLGVYIFLGLFGVVLLVAGCWMLFVNVITRSALHMHRALVDSTVRAPFQFFQRVDIGSITNRFSQDMDLIDMSLPLEALNYLAALCTCIVKLVILAVFAKYLAIAIPFIGGVIYLTQRMYLRTSRQLRLLDIEAKAPLYTHFLELVGGNATVRAFNWHNYFTKTCLSLLNTSQRPVYMLYSIQQCLGFVLDMLIAAMAVILVSTVVFAKDKFDAGDVGVALVMVMTFNSSLMQLIKFWTMMETSIGAVARVKGFVEGTERESDLDVTDTTFETKELPASWPDSGKVEFDSVVAGHGMTSNPVLNKINLTITPGQKIAIVGSSGSGKTTLLLALLRMIEIQSGCIKIDGHDLTHYPRAEIRQRLNVITQEPFLVAGSLRFNIDPFGKSSDEALITVLKRVGLWDVIAKHGQENTSGTGLDMQMNADTWSLGQRQLLCLARAMVRSGRVVLLDEAMSSVDHATETTMQSILETEFASHTVLSVIHRLRYVHRYDKVAVLDAGRLVEFDAPALLLDRDSRLRELWRAGTDN